MTGDTVLVTAPVEEVLTLAEARSQCEVDDTVHDYDLVGWLREGREDFEMETDRAVLTSTWDYILTGWPCCGVVRLPKGRLQSIASVTYYGIDDAAVVLPTTEYFVHTGRELGMGSIGLKYGAIWPSTVLRPNQSIVIRFVAGWATRAAVPEMVKSYVRLFVAHRYAHREAVLVGSKLTVDSKQMEVGLQRISNNLKVWHY
jgi:uncharacterized phiE125 gp8 family phage protein